MIDENKYLHKKLTNYNYRLKQVAKELNINNINMSLSSYVSRHSFATHLYHNNVSVNVISQALGHTNINTTSNYLKKFTEDQISNEIENIIG
jgi:site-specific recombinase XerD